MAQLCAASGGRKAEEVSALRWKINRILLAHLAKEDRLVYPALISSGDRRTASTAHLICAEVGDLAHKWRHYLSYWTVARIREDGEAFRAQTIAVEQALLARIEREETELFPLLQCTSSNSSRRNGSANAAGRV
jgi:iron-sulfur cluster repair protein YtfE (RIC family)